VKYGLFTCVSYTRKYFENFNKIYYESCKNTHPVFMHVLSKTNLFCLYFLHGLQVSWFQRNVTFEDGPQTIHAMLP